MSISYLLYNAPPEHSLMNEWDKDESHQIATSLEVKKIIMQLYPQIEEWDKFENSNTTPLYDYPVSYYALGNNNCCSETEYLDLSLEEHQDGYIHFITVRSGSPKLLRELIEAFKLKYIFEGQSCRLIDPYKYIGNWEEINDKL